MLKCGGVHHIHPFVPSKTPDAAVWHGVTNAFFSRAGLQSSLYNGWFVWWLPALPLFGAFFFHQLLICLYGALMSSQSLAVVCEIPHLTSNSHVVHLQKVLAMNQWRDSTRHYRPECSWKVPYFLSDNQAKEACNAHPENGTAADLKLHGLCSSQASCRTRGDGSVGTWRTDVRCQTCQSNCAQVCSAKEEETNLNFKLCFEHRRRFLKFKRQRHRAFFV